MKKNVGKIDAIIRLILGSVLIVLGMLYSKWWFLAAGILIITAVMKWCGLYKICSMSTCKVEPQGTEESSG